MILWAVCADSGYYTDSIWSTREFAMEEARRLGLDVDAEPLRFVQPWVLNKPEQHFKEFRASD